MPSADYDKALAATQHFHNTRDLFNGRFFLRYAAEAQELIRRYNCRTLLDYGCGKGQQWDGEVIEGQTLAEWLGLQQYTLFDPGYAPVAKEPEGKFDIVVCTQALGSIPIEDLPWVVDRLQSLATKVVFVGEKLAPVRKQVHADMADRMPHGWSREQWARALHRDSGTPIYLSTREKATGINLFGKV